MPALLDPAVWAAVKEGRQGYPLYCRAMEEKVMNWLWIHEKRLDDIQGSRLSQRFFASARLRLRMTDLGHRRNEWDCV
jgi:hypothetical protein